MAGEAKKVGDGGGNTGLPEGFVAVKKEDWDALNTKLTDFGRKLDVFEQSATSVRVQPAAPAAPAGPTIEQQLSEIDTQIDKLEDDLDAAIEAEKPTKELRAKIRRLSDKKAELRTNAIAANLEVRGVGMFEQITGTVMQPQFPLLRFAPVKREYDDYLSRMTPAMRANPEALMRAYQLAVGARFTEVMSLQAEETARAAAAGAATQVPKGGGGGGRQIPAGGGGGGGDEQTPEDFFGEDSMSALRAVGNRELDSVARAFGFANAKDYAAFGQHADEVELGTMKLERGKLVAAGGGA